MIRYSVIIPAYNAGDTLAACLGSLAQQTLAPDQYEIIVVDDGSEDNTGRIAQSVPAVRRIRQTKQGPAAARNRGVVEARGEMVLFIDADCQAMPDWIEQMAKPLAQPEIVAVKGAYRCRQPELVARVVQLEYELKYERMEREPFIDFIDTYSAAFRKNVFLETGGYDTRFTQASVEDQEFSFRLARRGCKMIFNPEAKVWHRHVTTLAAYCRKKWKIGFWKIWVLQRHPGKLVRDSHTPQMLKLEILCLAAGLGLGIMGLAGQSRLLLAVAGAMLLGPAVLAGVELRNRWRWNFALSLAAVGVFYLRSAFLGGGLVAGLAHLLSHKDARGIEPMQPRHSS
jgi:glycosyltransferase involved in cell wall biosynthesis